MKKLEELKSMSSFKKESDDFLRKVVGGDHCTFVGEYVTNVQGVCHRDEMLMTYNWDKDGNTLPGAIISDSPRPEVFEIIKCTTN